MHLSLRRAFGTAVPVLVASAVVAGGAAAPPASAASWQDTALVAGAVQAQTFGGAGLAAADGTKVIKLSGTGVTWSLHGTVTSGVSLSGTTISYTGAAVATAPEIIADATDSAGNAEALEIPVVIKGGSIQVNGPVVKVTVSALADLGRSRGSPLGGTTASRAVTRKMISSTSMMSTRGVTLMPAMMAPLWEDWDAMV